MDLADVIVAVAIGGVAVASYLKGSLLFALAAGLGALAALGGEAALGVVLTLPAAVSAVRLARPGSIWAKNFYGSPQRLIWSEKPPDEPPGTAKPPPQTADTVKAASSNLGDKVARERIAAFLTSALSREVIDRSIYGRLRSHLDDTYPARRPDEASRSAQSAPVAKASPPAPPIQQRPPQPVAPTAKPPPRQGAPPIPAAPGKIPAPPRRIEPGVRTPASSAPVAPQPAEPASTWEPAEALQRRATQLWELVGPDISIHGFTYLGLMLTFVGVFGFMFFSFADLPDAVQPFVEVLIPAIFFVWAWFLKRRDAVVVGDIMELLGGLVLPLVVFAGLVDDAPVPPDLTGGWLIAGLFAASLLIAASYAWWSARHPGSMLRYLVAPMVWVAALAPGFAFKTDEPLVSEAITRLVSAQPAFAAAAITATLVAIKRWPEHRLAAPSAAAAIPAVPITYLLTIALAAGEGWAYPAPLVLAGAATLGSTELLAQRYQFTKIVDLARPFLLVVTLVPLVPVIGVGWTGLVAVLAFLALLEWETRGEAETVALLLAGAGVLGGLAMTTVEPWLMVVGWAAASVWANVRRTGGIEGDDARQVLTIAAAALPAGVAVGLIQALPDQSAAMVIGVVLLAMTVAVGWSGTDDLFWKNWLTSAGGLLALGTLFGYAGGTFESLWPAAAAGLLAAGTLGGAPGWPAARVWMASGAAVLAMRIGLDAADVTAGAEPVWWAVAGLGAVVAAGVWSRPPAAHLAAVGHLVGLGALLAGGSQGARAFAVTAWTLGWLVAVIGTEIRHEPYLLSALAKRGTTQLGVTDDSLHRALDAAPSIVLAVSIPFTVLAWAGLWDEFAANRSWTGVVLALLAVAYGVSARLLAERRSLSVVFAAGAVTLSVLGMVVAAPASWPSIVAVASTVLVGWLVAKPLEWTLFTWFAWAMLGVLTVLLAYQAGLPARNLHVVVLVWGSAMLVGGLALDDIRAGRRRRGDGLRVSWAQYPVVLGALAIPLGLAPIYTQGPEVFGWVSLFAAAGYALVAVQLRAGAVTAPAYALAALGVAALSPWPFMEQPWLLVPIAAALVAASWGAQRLHGRDGAFERYQRWDLPPLVVAHIVGFVGLVRAAEVDSVPTWIGFGVLSVLVGVWKQHRAWTDAGNVLVLIGAAVAGPGWLALALAATSARGVIGATTTNNLERFSYHAMGVVAAGLAWVEVVWWLDWSTPQVVSYTALVFGALGMVVGGLIVWRGLALDWVVAWGGLALAGMAASGVLAPGNVVDGYAALGTLLFAVGSGLTTLRYRHWALQALTVGAVGWAWVDVVWWLDWSTPQVVSYTSLAAGTVALLAAVLLNGGKLSPSWTLAWGGLGFTGIAAAGALAPRTDISVAPAVGTSLFAVGAALAARRIAHRGMQALTVAAAGWAWVEVVLWQDWSTPEIASYTALAFGTLGAVVGAVVRWRGLALDWMVAWGGLALAGIVVSVALAPGNLVDVYPAIGTSLFALGSGLAARRIDHPGMQMLTVAAVGVAWAELVGGVGWGVEQSLSYTSLAAGSIAVVAAVSLRIGRLSGSWTIAWGALAVTGTVAAWLAAFSAESQAVAGPAPAVGLALLAVATMLGARPLSYPLHYASVGLTGWAWVALAVGLEWSVQTTAVTTAVTFGALGVVVSEIGRSRWGMAIRSDAEGLAAEAARAWLALGGVGVVAAAVLAATLDERLPAWLAVAIGLALLALALARGASPLGWPPLRELSALVALGSATVLGLALEAPAGALATGAILIGVAATLLSLWFWTQRPSSNWMQPFVLLGIAATVEALAWAVATLPRRDVLALVLLGTAVQVVAFGLMRQRPLVVSLGPPIVLAAWIGVASEAAVGSALWFTVPVALALIAEVDIVRWSRRRAEEPLVTPDLLALEYAAIGLLGAVVLVEMFASGVAFSLLAFAFSGGLLLWAAVTRVRRRAVAAAVLATVTAVLAIFAAAAAQAPPSAFFWIVAAGAGFAVMLAMALVEAYRSKTGSVMLRIDELMEDWE